MFNYCYLGFYEGNPIDNYQALHLYLHADFVDIHKVFFILVCFFVPTKLYVNRKLPKIEKVDSDLKWIDYIIPVYGLFVFKIN